MSSVHIDHPSGSLFGLYRVVSLLSTSLFSSLHSRTPLFTLSFPPSSLPSFLSTKLSPSSHPPTSTDSQSCCIATSSETYWRCRTICLSLFSLPPLFQFNCDLLGGNTHITKLPSPPLPRRCKQGVIANCSHISSFPSRCMWRTAFIQTAVILSVPPSSSRLPLLKGAERLALQQQRKDGMSTGFREKWIEGKQRDDCGVRRSPSPRSKVRDPSSDLKAGGQTRRRTTPTTTQ